jgi:cephalosporin hydroxylase
MPLLDSPTPIDVSSSLATFGSRHGFTQHHQRVPMWKAVQDLARYRRVIEATRPEVIVETGTRWGGTAAWFADTFGVPVITVDVSAAPDIEGWPNVTAVTGNSIRADIVARVARLVAERRCMVSLDSDHHYPHVLAEIRAYGPLVTPGCYLVVEDALADLVVPDEARRFGARIPEKGGPLPAIEQELAGNPDWVRDLDVEGMDPVSHHPYGWWRRV